jgi:8-oxo-dGTP pyrophosphatase MutT (NUDIX family)
VRELEVPGAGDDPRIVQLRRVFEGRYAPAVERTDRHREAAVSLVLRPAASLEVLLIRRAEFEGDPWSGHIALPGGRRSAADDDLLVTACRETEEEVGVPLRRLGSLIGALDEITPGTPLLPPIVIAPFVMAVPAATQAAPDAREVQAAIWVPLDALRDRAALSEIAVDLPDGLGSRSFPSLIYEDFVIWGLTYRILAQFMEITKAGTGSGS